MVSCSYMGGLFGPFTPLHSDTEELVYQIRQMHHLPGGHWSLLQVVNLTKHGSCSGNKSLNVNIFLLSCLKCCGSAFYFGMGRSDQMMAALWETPDLCFTTPEPGLGNSYMAFLLTLIQLLSHLSLAVNAGAETACQLIR